MFRRIFMVFKNNNIKKEYIQQNILLLGNKFYINNNSKMAKQNLQEEQLQNCMLFKNNKETNFYGYSIKVLDK